jgi:hypothetical protein
LFRQRRVIEKFAIHSQNKVAERLAYLVEKFKGKRLKQSAQDVHYGVLHFLLLLSENPLEALREKSFVSALH